MRLEYVGPRKDGLWSWRIWNAHEKQWWTFACWLELHQALAYAAGWRAWGGPK